MAGNKIQPHLDEIKRLYFAEGIPLQEIGERFGVTKQAVHHALTTAEGRLRGRRPRVFRFDTSEIKRLYVEEMLTQKEISQKTGLTVGRVSEALRFENVKLRSLPKQRWLFEYDGLEIGDSIVTAKPNIKGIWYSVFYQRAQKVGIRVSVRTVDNHKVRVTRIG